MASRSHRRRSGADRFWPGPQAGAGPGADLTGLDAPEAPAVPVQPSWSDNWAPDPGANNDANDGDGESEIGPADFGAPDFGAPEAGRAGASASQVQRDPEAAARSICLRLLTIEPRTRAQLAQAMQRKNIPDAVAESILDRFTEAGLIDDQAFARAWVDSRHHSRGLSRRVLSTELRRRGVADDDVREAVETLDPDQEVATARQIVDRKLRSTRGQPPEARVRRLVGALARKGYSPVLSYRIVREALEAEGGDGPELAGVLDDSDPETILEDGQG